MSEVIWHEVECGGYAADLRLWSGLAREAAGPVLELGCGTGRIALALARDGREVTGLDRDPELVAELGRRADRAGVGLTTACADARRFDLGRRFALVIAPMQLVHLLGGEAGRAAMLRCASEHLASAAALAISVLAPVPHPVDAVSTLPLPDVLERDGWVYASLPVEMRDTGDGLEVRRLRQAVSPSGELTETVDITRLDPLHPGGLTAEAEAAGLAPRERLEVPATTDHVGSTIVVLEPARGG